MSSSSCHTAESVNNSLLLNIKCKCGLKLRSSNTVNTFIHISHCLQHNISENMENTGLKFEWACPNMT